MGREHKYRAYEKKDPSKVIENWQDSDMVGYQGFDGGDFAHVVQYTGLKDSEGSEIYEGDFVEFTYWWFDGNHAESLLSGEIVYLSDCMSFGLKGVKNKEWLQHIGGDTDTAAFANWLFDEADFKVIGNIHQNPELLEAS